MIIEHENTVQTQAEYRDSDEEMSYDEIKSHLIGEVIPKRGRIATCAVIAASFLVISLVFWVTFATDFYKRGITGNNEDYSLITAQKIRLLQQMPDGTLSSEIPAWIHEDLREKIFQNLALEPGALSIYCDTQLDYVQNALDEIYWIKKVYSIRKLYPAFLEIVVSYRQPVLLVRIKKPETSDETQSSENPCCFLPLANNCCILPNDERIFPIAAGKLDEFPVFVGEAPDFFYETENPIDVCDFPGYPAPRSTFPGQIWDYDSQIRDVTGIVELLGDRWQKYDLDYICIEYRANNPEIDFPENQYCIVTRNGSRIHWGRRIVQAANKDDVLDEEKVEQLDKLIEKDGRLDSKTELFDMTFRRKTNFEQK